MEVRGSMQVWIRPNMYFLTQLFFASLCVRRLSVHMSVCPLHLSSKAYSSYSFLPIATKLGKNVPWVVLPIGCVFFRDSPKNCTFCKKILKKLTPAIFGRFQPNLIGTILGWFPTQDVLFLRFSQTSRKIALAKIISRP